MSVASQEETVAKLEEMRRLSERLVELSAELAYGPFTNLDRWHRQQIGSIWARGVPYQIDEALEALR